MAIGSVPIIIDAHVQDACNPEVMAHMRARLHVPFGTTDKELIDLILLGIEKAEQHETDEWARFDGVPINPPHSEVWVPDSQHPWVEFTLHTGNELAACERGWFLADMGHRQKG